MEKITTIKIEINVNRAEPAPSLESALNVRGSDANQQTIAVMNAKAIVHTEWSVIVFKYSAPTRQCSPYTCKVSMNLVLGKDESTRT